MAPISTILLLVLLDYVHVDGERLNHASLDGAGHKIAIDIYHKIHAPVLPNPQPTRK